MPRRPSTRVREPKSSYGTRIHTILVAEDEEAVRRVLVRRLHMLCTPCKMIEAITGTAALHLLATTLFDGVVTDHLMPGATGLEVLQAARTAIPTIPVIILSARPEVAADALRAGANAFVPKPFTLAELDAALRLVIP